MTPLAWIFLGSAWTVISGCGLYAFGKVLFSPRGLDNSNQANDSNDH